MTTKLPGIDKLQNRLGSEDPTFSAWRDEQPDKHWAKLDLSALRIGYELGRSVGEWPRCQECGAELELIRPHTFDCPKCPWPASTASPSPVGEGLTLQRRVDPPSDAEHRTDYEIGLDHGWNECLDALAAQAPKPASGGGDIAYKLRTVLGELSDAVHAEVSPTYSERLDDAFTRAEIVEAEYDRKNPPVPGNLRGL